MKKIIYSFLICISLLSCKSMQNDLNENQPIIAAIDLVDVQQDKVMVSVDPGRFSTDSTTFFIPKTVPGTYSTSNFGKYAEDFKAYDYDGDELEIVQVNQNTWTIPNAEDLDRITYWVNDTFDVPGEGGIYSMAGTNILKDKNFLLNLHGFIGYFEGQKEDEYRLKIKRPEGLIAGTALDISETRSPENANYKTDIYNLDRYFEVTDNPVMYAAPDTVSFDVKGMEVLLSVYSPNNKFSAESFEPAMKKMITAQKDFLGDIDNTDKYAILLYLSENPGQGDAANFGALEHHTSTVVVMPEEMEKAELEKSLTDIVSHEFFHIITPLGIHSNEIHYFDYNDPEMSKHLWLYEGVTEYFANLFQVNQELIEDEEFYARLVDKIITSRRFDDTMSFTVMSENILEEKYQDSYYNVYQKGALIGMALDIRLRELSNGEMGLIDLMKELTEKYGKDRPFNDDELIPAIVDLTYPEIGNFFKKYVIGTTPIPYDKFFEKVGLDLREELVPVGYLLKNESTPYIRVNKKGEILVREDIELSTFFEEAGLKPGDVIKSINGKNYSAENVYDLVASSTAWKKGDEMEIVVIRNGQEKTLQTEIVQPMAKGLKLVEIPNADSEQVELRYAWLESKT